MTPGAKIVFEKEETLVLRQSRATMNEYCSLCQMLTTMVTPEALAMMSGLSEREIFRLIETSELHFYERPKVYVCLNSLAAIEQAELNHRSKRK